MKEREGQNMKTSNEKNILIEKFGEIKNWNWFDISVYQKLSEQFITDNKENVIWSYISEYQKLSEQLIKDNSLEIPVNSWFYKDLEYKREYAKTTGYEIEGDFLYAYKSCRSDGYSKFNFQYYYEVGKSYESQADFNSDNENSFGLSAWTREGALDYCKEKLFRVKVYIGDIACFVHGNNKIRCTKLEIVEEIII